MKEKIQIPVLVATGGQSSGKTSFIETLVGFPVGFTDRKTGNRCPSRYILRSGASHRWTVGGRSLNTRTAVREAVREHMKALEPHFSSEVLVIGIEEPDMIDLDIIDLVGTKDRGEPDYQEIVNIVRPFLSDPNVIPVVRMPIIEVYLSILAFSSTLQN